MIISIAEIIGLVAITLYIGYIFTGFIKIKPQTVYHMMHPKRFDLTDFKFSILATAPAVVLHELGHKFVAMAFGLSATFYAFYSNSTTMFLAVFSVILKAIGSPFIFLVPGFVQIPLGLATPLQYRLIAFAGPFINLALWGGSALILEKAKNLNRTKQLVLAFTKRINMILFFFNMLPFGPLDGAKVLFGP